MDTCELENCDRPRGKGRNLCHAHRQRLRKHGDVMADMPVRNQWRPGDPITDEPISYDTAHNRVRSARGKASDHPCANGCGRQARHWSYLDTSAREQTGTHKGRQARWSPDPQDYAPRCAACHADADVRAAHENDPNYVPLGSPVAKRLPITPEVAKEWGYPEVWPSCEVDGCPKPARRSHKGFPRRLCSKHQKDREVARNTDPCTAPHCELPRWSATATCRWHYLHGAETPMPPEKLELSLRARARAATR